MCLEQFIADATDDNYEPSPKRIRMERQIRLLQEKNTLRMLVAKKAFSLTLSEKSHSMLLESLHMQDWTYVLLKVRTKISDSAWQTLLNLTQLGRTGKTTDFAILPTKNQICAIKDVIFRTTYQTVGIGELPDELPGGQVQLAWGCNLPILLQKLNIYIVTLDYKALLLIVIKKERKEEDPPAAKIKRNILGGRGLSVEFCVFCTAIRGCACPGLAAGETCIDCFAKSKGNIGNWKGIRDDLTLLLDEEMHSVNLCALHCEMRNTEQILGSLGLYAYKIGSLDNLNCEAGRVGTKIHEEKLCKN
ncbi:uncharacterized protein LOC114526542 [Dendronephthya gigantea]|uniref:uncharacterized protein LOC114526542 n=1 Tax=Dendronephthya gigantea TaxID=151771 RepID=UPI001069F432|nr:uncharacterized protein LOC114526542 [Dendronephthya gigantea]